MVFPSGFQKPRTELSASGHTPPTLEATDGSRVLEQHFATGACGGNTPGSARSPFQTFRGCCMAELYKGEFRVLRTGRALEQVQESGLLTVTYAPLSLRP